MLSDYTTTKKKTVSGLSRFITQTTPKLDTTTSQGLYQLAVQAGLQKDADRILASQQGEDTKKIFSGGFISDIFDTLNALQYGVVGVLKGKSFMEGVKTRQSFSDKDALGDKGLPGVIAGIALDIAVDPLTYIAPATILKKIPGLSKLGTAVKSLIFGKKVQKAVDVGGDIAKGARTYETIEGGTKAGKWLADKFVWMFGKDKVYKEAYQRSVKNIAVGTQNVADMAKGIANLTPEVTKKLLKTDETGRLARVGLKELQKILTPEEFAKVAPAWAKIDDLGKQAVDLGLLSKGKFEENFGEYIKNAYTEYETAKKGIFGYGKVGVKGIKARKAVENVSEFGLTQIDNPAYLLFKSTFDLTKDIENAKLFNVVSKSFGTDVAQVGFTQLPKAQKFVTTTGKQVDILTGIKKVNEEIKPTIKALKQTFIKDKEVLSLIKSIEGTIGELSGKRADELTKFFSAPLNTVKTMGGGQVIKGVGKLPDNLKEIGDAIKKFDKFSNLMKSGTGIKLEKLFEDGVLERAGFTEIEDLFKFVKNSYKKIPEVTKEVIQKGNLPKVVQLQRQIEELTPKLENIKGIDKRSIDDAYRYFEDTLNTLSGKKETLIEELGTTKLADLAGKYVPENIAKDIMEIIEPSKEMAGKALMANFKFAKVILNPATHARNIVSNQVLNWWKLGMNPLDPRTLKAQGEAIGEIAKKGGKWMDEAKTAGYGLDTFASQELRTLLDSPEALGIGKKIGNAFEKAKSKLGNIYQEEENFAKLSAFIFQRKKGLGIEDAWKAAESATFNYAQVTPFIRKLRTSLFGFPFITFTTKATPLAVETALKAPGRISVFGKVKSAIESQSDLKETERERAAEPGYIRDGFYIKLPIKDKQGRSAYFDLTYIIPFGDLVSGNFFDRQVDRESGTKESLPSALMSKSPFFQFVKEIGKNQDFYGDKIWQDSDSTDKQLGDLMRHLTKTYMPPLVADQIPGGYNSKGEQRRKGVVGALTASPENEQRNLMQEMLRNIGAKIQPIDVDIQETYAEWNKQKALETLLRERGVGAEFSKFFVPKANQ